MRTISVLCYSESGPDEAERLCLSAFKEATYFDRVEIVLLVDDEEMVPEYDYMTNITYRDFDNISFLYSEQPIRFSQALNEMACRCVGEVILIGSDTMSFETKGWDDILDEEMDEYPDEIVCVKIGNTPVITKKWHDILDRVVPRNIATHEDVMCYAWLFDVATRLHRLHEIDTIDIEREPILCDSKIKTVMNWFRTDSIREQEAEALREYLVDG